MDNQLLMHRDTTIGSLWDTRTLAKKLGVAEQTIRKWVWERRIPSVKIGGRRMFERDEIERWINENRRPEIGRQHD